MTRSKNPYTELPAENFWRSGVVDPGPFGIRNLFHPKFWISPTDRIATAGSCFAQRLSAALAARQYAWVNAEPAPPMMSASEQKAFNYGIFSARTGNIYSTGLLRQWVSWALDGVPANLEAWTDPNGRIQDPFRPEIEPGGFADLDEMERSRRFTLAALRSSFETADVFVFTLGLTEAWRNKGTGFVYPSCPGTVAGCFDTKVHELKNYEFEEVKADLEWAICRLREFNSKLRVVLTVSPVPLTATAEQESHALTANTYTKSLLRTVAGSLSRKMDFIDYFPGYEMVATPPFKAMFYAPNMRTVDPFGVDYVMEQFVSGYRDPNDSTPQAATTLMADINDEDLVCHDYILEYYNAQH